MVFRWWKNHEPEPDDEPEPGDTETADDVLEAASKQAGDESGSGAFEALCPKCGEWYDPQSPEAMKHVGH